MCVVKVKWRSVLCWHGVAWVRMNDKSGSKLQASNMARNHVISKSEEGFSHQNLSMLKWEMRWNLQCSVGLCCIPRLRVADGAPDAAVFFSRRIRHFLNYVSELMSLHTLPIHSHACSYTLQSLWGPQTDSLSSLPRAFSLPAIYTRERERESNTWTVPCIQGHRDNVKMFVTITAYF